jgi:transcriptional regulator with XRE-family HTH domain
VAIAQLPPFAKLLRHHRALAVLTQEELAERAGLSARAISDLERGAKTRPHRVTVDLLADALDLPQEDRARLVAAVPCTCGSPVETRDHDRQAGVQPLPLQTQAVRSSSELRQVLEGLVGMYVEEERHDRQINVAVIVFSTEKM